MNEWIEALMFKWIAHKRVKGVSLKKHSFQGKSIDVAEKRIAEEDSQITLHIWH